MDRFNLRYFKTNALIYLIGVLVLLLFLANQFISNHWGISFAVFASVIGFVKFIDKKFWNKLPFKFLYAVPDFSGRYVGTLESEYRDDNCEKITKKMEHIKVIVQNGSNVVINSWTKKEDGNMSSKSRSINAIIIKEADASYSLLYNYLNEGNNDPDLHPHYGTEKIHLVENGDGKHLVGKYYTERKPFQTKGRIEMKYENNNLSNEIF